MRSIGAMLVVFGLALALAGAALMFANRLPFLGHLPGDINVRGKSASFHFPLATCVLISIVLTILINIVLRLMRR